MQSRKVLKQNVLGKTQAYLDSSLSIFTKRGSSADCAGIGLPSAPSRIAQFGFYPSIRNSWRKQTKPVAQNQDVRPQTGDEMRKRTTVELTRSCQLSPFLAFHILPPCNHCRSRQSNETLPAWRKCCVQIPLSFTYMCSGMWLHARPVRWHRHVLRTGLWP